MYTPAPVNSHFPDLRVELREIQSANRGRKFGVKDRRAVDPPPVVQLQAFRTVHDGINFFEVEVEDYSAVEVSGLICHLDVFPLSSSPHPTPAISDGGSLAAASYGQALSTVTPYQLSQPGWQTYPPQMASEPAPVPLIIYRAQHQPYEADPVVVWVNGTPFRESEAITSEAFGSREVEATRLCYEGNHIVVFTFCDLALKRAGSCFFRYRAFDLRSRISQLVAGSSDGPIPMLGECYAQASTMIWDTKSFPGLDVSTPLSQAISNQTASQRPRVRVRAPKTKGA
ncbi:hypothetical protein PUNSTDRAFT_50106 [Punctularia strigosozonata HHB-11173 SS5]|uniref:uncharacterized protein n=1 Tax=Punctularia strigosozonata (strain HHB-11173) TaxID=741275 RepID=UPI0004417512|nr:uncharacterized protein PUNSTDRAFT_50106 [Punctularia strigosozonata HHB-11173 SS5]EIN12888.1 hypothetical protein PUNSTDRAFT_50106 [Punctularia strigosozonata HHB-11173 SS5]